MGTYCVVHIIHTYLHAHAKLIQNILYITSALRTYLTSEAGRGSVIHRLELSDCGADCEPGPQQGGTASFRISSGGTLTLKFRRTW